MIEYINNRFVWRKTTTQGMGKVFADIELLNGDDVSDARRNIIGEDEIKRIPICALVDTGSDYLCINENIQEVLKLPFVKFKYAELADGRVVKCEVVGPVDIRFENVDCNCRAMVLPGDSEPLLGLIPLESMDVVIDPNLGELVVGPARPITRL
jgi:clan AA aspartic protease